MLCCRELELSMYCSHNFTAGDWNASNHFGTQSHSISRYIYGADIPTLKLNYIIPLILKHVYIHILYFWNFVQCVWTFSKHFLLKYTLYVMRGFEYNRIFLTPKYIHCREPHPYFRIYGRFLDPKKLRERHNAWYNAT